MRMYKPCENQELLGFKEYLKDVLLEIIEAILEQDMGGNGSNYALECKFVGGIRG